MASNVKPHQRAFALTIAVIFLVTTVATSVFVIMTIISENKTNQSLQSQDETPGNLSVDDSSATPQNQEGEMLQGTKLENFEPVTSVDSLQVIDIKEGDGATVQEGATVTAHYTGAIAETGVIFQSSHDSGQPIPFSLNGVIEGWTKGVPGMKVGGVRRLVIPAAQAYGANPPQGSGIPANAPLVFDIELVDVQQ